MLLTLMITKAYIHGQGTFQNLDFEAATIPQTQQPGFVNTTAAFPGWAAYLDTNRVTQVGFNDFSLGATAIALLGTNAGSLQGGYSALLQGGLTATPTGFIPTAASISQTGLVPPTARSLLFQGTIGSGGLSVSLGGQHIPLVVLSNSASLLFIGGDISAFAGQIAELKFSALSPFPQATPSNWRVDGIEFSDFAVPEPSAFTLYAFGMLVLGRRAVGICLGFRPTVKRQRARQIRQ